jgi:hypothetical protein
MVVERKRGVKTSSWEEYSASLAWMVDELPELERGMTTAGVGGDDARGEAGWRVASSSVKDEK